MKAGFAALATTVLCASFLSEFQRPTIASASEASEHAPTYAGNESCKTCHESIYRSYSRTPMALTSGTIGDNFVEGSFEHKVSAVLYRITRQNDQVFLNYQRLDDPSVRGSQQLSYFIGSGRRGRSYLFSIDGFLYESPASYYSRDRRWDISPGFESRREMPFNRPIEPSCLYCHASQVKPIHGTQNRYESPPFAQAGVGCEQCHGPGSAHIQGLASMTNPAKLPPARRDSICEQCHLSGESRINQPCKNLGMFSAGDLLSDYVLSFVYEGKVEHFSRAVSHIEAMAQSRCKRQSGDEMSCLSCHDPHVMPSPEDAAAYFREKCLACHLKQSSSASRKQHYEKLDCRGCHMPKTSDLSIRHTVLTDHRIPRKLPESAPQTERGAKLIQFGAKQSDPRGLALAYAEMALQEGLSFYKDEAFRRLTAVLVQYPNDAEVLTRLGYLYQSKGDLDHATALYEKALHSDSHLVAAQVNLGVIYALRERIDDAIVLWREALSSNPGLSEAGVDLALALWAKGEKAEARRILHKVLRFNPDLASAKKLQSQMK